MESLKDKIIVVTGATSGLGLSLTKCLLNEGANLITIGRNLSELKELEKIHSKNINIIQCDLAVDDEIKDLIKNIKLQNSKIDVLIHSAGIFLQGSVYTHSIEELDKQYKLNTRVPYYLTQQLLPLFNKKYSQLVFINSTSGTTTKEGVSQYSASKYGLRAIADSLRIELNGKNVKVLSVFPGKMATPMQEKILEDENKNYDEEFLINPDDVSEIITDTLKMSMKTEITDIHIRPFKKM